MIKFICSSRIPRSSVSLSRRFISVLQLSDGIQKGDRASLAKAITLVESTLSEHRIQAQSLIQTLSSVQPLRSTQQQLSPSIRIGLSGSPGVGKSTFIEAFGMFLVQKGHNVAVLAVDPSSSQTGGSILGDKTRMHELSKHPNAFVRPSPSRGTLGGVARNTTEAIILCEAAGYDIIIIETVGVGQSEVLVSDMVDLFMLLVSPSGGDELQGIKKGIVELADLVVVNKADGNLLHAAQMTQLEYVSALKLLRPRKIGDNQVWRTPVMRASAQTGEGISKVWDTIIKYYSFLLQKDDLHRKRSLQRKKWMWRLVTDELIYRLGHDEEPGYRWSNCSKLSC